MKPATQPVTRLPDLGLKSFARTRATMKLSEAMTTLAQHATNPIVERRPQLGDIIIHNYGALVYIGTIERFCTHNPDMVEGPALVVGNDDARFYECHSSHYFPLSKCRVVSKPPVMPFEGEAVPEAGITANADIRPLGAVCADCLHENCTNPTHNTGWIMKDSLRSPALPEERRTGSDRRQTMDPLLRRAFAGRRKGKDRRGAAAAVAGVDDLIDIPRVLGSAPDEEPF